jgi:hypothetical protein
VQEGLLRSFYLCSFQLNAWVRLHAR